ncbi:MAG: damage-inducible protein [Rhodospirillales bacterium]|nr:damage-inducible protein [Rhodospirillales bacterium]
MSRNTSPALALLRARIERLERPAERRSGVLPLGVGAIDAHLPGGGLALGALHEIAGSGGDAAATLFVAGLLARLPGPVLWCQGAQGLFAPLFPPGLAGAGLAPDRVIHLAAGEEKTVLLAMEEGLGQPGLAGVVGELSRLPMTASRRLALATEATGVFVLVLVRREKGEKPEEEKIVPNAAATRWRVAPLPAPRPAWPHPAWPGLERALWRLDLVRCRGRAAASWMVEACDATGCLGLAGVLPDRSAAPLPARRARA